MKSNKLITILGPTAIGKTALSIQLAKAFSTEILSCDSRQFYKEMTLGTAVPSSDELKAVKHHFIQNRSIFENYSVGAFEKDVIQFLEKAFKSNPVMIMVGGSGLYVDAVTKGLDEFPEVDPEIRIRLKERLVNEGIEPLQNALKDLDIITYERMDIDNQQRLIRALEICLGTGKPYAYYLGKEKKIRNFSAIKIGLTAPRKFVYERINQRVDIMMQEGLLEEARKLYPYKHLNALQTVGYRELFRHIEGELSLEEAVDEVKKNTRRFAKRQGTYFRKDPNIKWFDIDTGLHEIIQYVEKSLE